IGRVRLGNEADVNLAVAAAKRAFGSFSRTSKEERIALLHRLHDAVAAKEDALIAASVEEYGGAVSQTKWRTSLAARSFLDAARILETYEFTRWINDAEVVMEPLGVVGIITPWNSNTGFICGKLAVAIAAGCTTVIKPSEMSAIQTQIVLDALHEAGIPKGVFNLVQGSGEVVGAALSAHPDVAKISFTGSTAVGKAILRASAETMKRVTLELGGKSPMLILDDADFAQAVPFALAAGIMNNGQACIAGTRILVPDSRHDEFVALLRQAVEQVKVGDPNDPETQIGPLVSRKQWQRVQRYIAIGIGEGATLSAGGEGKPAGLEHGFFVKPTLFTEVTNDMTIAREEIFGPVLSVIRYRDQDEAIAIANDTTYGLQAYVASSDDRRARDIASQLVAGRVLINNLAHEPLAPFGGFKQSGIGREMGVFGLEAHLEPKTVLGRKRAA
ncbi:MAG: aldehyde dehydrogenase family protein, partial [Rhodospirillales bacterium]|nr:aldehyde dehydrogenase family protein [Rhodospirillales bacterium]